MVEKLDQYQTLFLHVSMLPYIVQDNRELKLTFDEYELGMGDWEEEIALR